MNNQKLKDRRLLEYIKSNKKKIYSSVGMVLIFVFMLTTDVIMIPNELQKHVNNHWYIETLSMFLFVLILSLPLSRTYKEESIEDWHLSINKLFWVFLIGVFSLTNVRNSYLYNIDNKEKMITAIKYLDKELQELKQTNNEKYIEQ